MKRGPKPKYDGWRAHELKRQGKTDRAIARALGCSHSTVGPMLRRSLVESKVEHALRLARELNEIREALVEKEREFARLLT